MTLRKQGFDDGNEQSPPPTSELLQRVLQIRAQIIEESGGYLFEDSAEAVRRMREERTQSIQSSLCTVYSPSFPVAAWYNTL